LSPPRLDGLDIHDVYQPVSDWAAIPNFPLMTVKVTDGTGKPRPGGIEYMRQFRRRGFRYRGVYHWLRSNSTMAAQIARLAEAIGLLGGLEEGEFIQLDWETTPGIPNLTVAQIEEWIDLAEAKWPGRIIVYASDWVPGFAQWRNANPKYPLWYANYNTGTGKTGGWVECERWSADVWQYTSSLQIPGIAALRVDGNHIRNYSTLDRITHGNWAAPPVVVGPTIPAPAPPAPSRPLTGTAGNGKDNEMLVLNLGTPGVDSWWTQLAVTVNGIQHSTGPLAAIIARSSYPASDISEAELKQLLTRLRTLGASPFDPASGTPAPNQGLHDLWVSASA
jgi:hypothetical protein